MADTKQNPAGGGNTADPANLKVNVAESVRPGVYSNAVSVNVNSNEVVVDFGYLLPNTKDPEIEVVARVNMNHKTAESFLNVLGGAMEDFKKKQAAAPAPGHTPEPVPAPQAAPAPMPHAAPAPVAYAAPAPAPMPAPMPAPAPMPPAPGAAMPPQPPMPPMPPMPTNA
ncbi:MAG: hypothetical protein ACI9QC_000475 [Oceanicoccus sp.]|jgi:hypothetical protein